MGNKERSGTEKVDGSVSRLAVSEEIKRRGSDENKQNADLNNADGREKIEDNDEGEKFEEKEEEEELD